MILTLKWKKLISAILGQIRHQKPVNWSIVALKPRSNDGFHCSRNATPGQLYICGLHII